ncbi:MFS transporter [Mesorhizobium sp. VNQ89]|uniref:MFS transporter n=1 Tax=Mesorhizobium quangtriensis TaxID=3157709 RepID=UPI0032B6FE98
MTIHKLGAAAWVVYGVGSSGYVLMIPVIGYATYFHTQVAGGGPEAATYWALAVAGALLVTGLIAPLLGAFADGKGKRRQILALLTALACISTAALTLIRPGEIVTGMAVFIIAHTAFLLAKAIYDSYLPVLGEPNSLSVISGLGWGLGYLGSVACFFLCLPFIQSGAENIDPGTFALAFLVTGVFFACLSLPAVFVLPRDDVRERSIAGPGAFGRLGTTLKEWRQHRDILSFLLAFYLINDAVVTILFFIGIFFKTNFGLSVEEILKLTLLFFLVGVPATIAFGWLGRVWSERGALFVTLLIWLILIAIMALGHGERVPLTVAIIAGLVIGSSQSLCRSIYAQMIPADRSSEFFGFNALVGRASAALGPLVFGVVNAASGSQRMGMASIGGFIVLGGLILAYQRPSQRTQSQGAHA